MASIEPFKLKTCVMICLVLLRLALASSSSSPCADTAKSCTEWANRGECKSNNNYMLVHCPRTCGLCGDNATADTKVFDMLEETKHDERRPDYLGVNIGDIVGVDSPASDVVATAAVATVADTTLGITAQSALLNGAGAAATAAAATLGNRKEAATLAKEERAAAGEVAAAAGNEEGMTLVHEEAIAEVEAATGAGVAEAGVGPAGLDGTELSSLGELSVDLSDISAEMDAARGAAKEHPAGSCVPVAAGPKFECD